MTKNVCIFVDGENFRKSIVSLFDDFDQREYLPNADWANLFNEFVKEIDLDCVRLRTYWYVIEHIEFYPYRLRALRKNSGQLKKVLYKNQIYEKELKKLAGEKQKNRMDSIVDDLLERRRMMQRRFEGWTNIQENISMSNRSIEFRRAGAISYNLFTKELGQEKAVDVKLATDLISLADIYNIAVIVSGDQDFVPAVKAVKDFGKQVVNVSFLTRSGKLLPGGARRLNQETDWCIQIHHDNLHNLLFS